MKNIGYLIIITFFGLVACNDESLSKEQEFELLQKQFTEITTIAESVSCENSEDWTFTAYGSKACGGPQGYIAYPLSIDTVTFLEKIENYRIAEERFNIKWGIISDCGLWPAPSSVACENGKAVLIY